MGCVSSKKAVSVTPVLDSSNVSRELDGILANSLWARARGEGEGEGEGECERSESGKVSSKSASSRSLRLGNLHKYIEGEQVAAGWPAWLSAVAKEAIQGWVPLKSESSNKRREAMFE